MAGVIKEFSNEERCYYTAADVSALCGVCRDKAYRIIRELRSEAIAYRKIPMCYPAGRIPKKYFNERMMV